jgi:hypothetical protein
VLSLGIQQSGSVLMCAWLCYAFKCRSRQNNQKSHQTNKSRYDKRAKERTFEMGDIVYLSSPAKKIGQCQNFESFGQARIR